MRLTKIDNEPDPKALCVRAVVKVRPMADIEAEQSDAKETVRNDRPLGVSENTHLFAEVSSIEDLGPNSWTN
jgi:hypothetical protein